MKAELDTAGGKPVLRLMVGQDSHYSKSAGTSRRSSIDIPLTEEQRRQIFNFREASK